MQKIIERYREQAKDNKQTDDTEANQYLQQLKLETTKMAKKIELLEISKRKLLGRDISSCSYEELQGINRQLEQSLCIIKARKEAILLDENARLRENFQVGFQKLELHLLIVQILQFQVEMRLSPTSPIGEKAMQCGYAVVFNRAMARGSPFSSDSPPGGLLGREEETLFSL
ncbi:hypothetical protein TIFTF001_047014 [Ficus carica]|uniref:K-box domain-containing protein n=1 Tax=Ficus carica TaxID=3494 RepID=A0AA88CVV3_FICCA|nr:hypothetical protein TIFTF001_047014 [Ficus carica]